MLSIKANLETEVLGKCQTLRLTGMWPSSTKVNPLAWLHNFDAQDRPIASVLLNNFTYYNEDQVNALLLASYNSIGDGLPKGPEAPSSEELVASLDNAVFTLVTGETPNPTDSGYLFCRKARQVLGIPENLYKEPKDALSDAKDGATVVFLDDFFGSGDQFIHSWKRPYGIDPLNSFSAVHEENKFVAIYVSLIGTDIGLSTIQRSAPSVAICTAHLINEKSRFTGLEEYSQLQKYFEDFLEKYSTRLTPSEEYMNKNSYLKYGYKNLGLMLGFAHSIPDATLPIFWSKGTNNWRHLIERS